MAALELAGPRQCRPGPFVQHGRQFHYQHQLAVLHARDHHELPHGNGGLATHNFFSAALGIAVAIAFIRGFSRHSARTLGNFWVDFTRATVYVLLPLSIVGALLLCSQGALREMAMRHTAHEVEERLAIPEPGPDPLRRERILICLTSRPSSANLIRRGKRVADYLQADCLALHVCLPSEKDPESVERHLSFARNLRIQTHTINAEDLPRAITEFARAQGVTQIFMGRSLPRPLWNRFRENLVQQVVRMARDMQVIIVAERRR